MESIFPFLLVSDSHYTVSVKSESFSPFMLKNSPEADGFSGQAGVAVFSGAAAGDGVGRGIKTLMGLLTGADLRGGALF